MSTLSNYKELNMVIFLNHIYLKKSKPTRSPPPLLPCPVQFITDNLTHGKDPEYLFFSCIPPWHIKLTNKHPTSASIWWEEGTPGGYFYSACGRIRLVRCCGVCSWRRDITPAPRTPWVGTASWQAGTQHPSRGSIRLARWLLTTSDGALTPRTQNVKK